jgi:hypothetical protein
MSQEVHMYTQESEDDESNDGGETIKNFEERFEKDSLAMLKKKEEQGDVYAALIPLWKELLVSVEKTPAYLPEACTKFRSMIANFNIEDDGKSVSKDDSSMALPLANGRKRKQPRRVEES